MRQIEIQSKIAPFSHSPGTSCVIPLSDWVVTAYPALLRIRHTEVPIRITGPVEQFLVQLDLERNVVWVSGISQEGYYRLKLSAIEEGVALSIDRAPKAGILIGANLLKAKDKILLASGGKFTPPASVERISFGNWKAQDWDLVQRRNDLREIVPALFLLGQKVPPSQDVHGGPAALINGDLPLFFKASCSGILVPHLHDVLHQGLLSEEGRGDPLSLLPMAYRKIRQSILDEETLTIAPALLTPAGRATNLAIANLGRIDLEWTKGRVRRMIVHPAFDCEAALRFPKEITTFRCEAKRIENGEKLSFVAGRKVLLDHFQK